MLRHPMLLMVLIALAVLIGTLISRHLWDNRATDTREKIRILEQAIDTYVLSFNEPPLDLRVLLRGDDDTSGFIKAESDLLDAWGQPFQYEYIDKVGPVIWTQTPFGGIVSNRPLPAK